MPRALKTLGTLAPQAQVDFSVPKSNQLTLSLEGLDLSPEQLASVRQEAVKAAMLAAGRLTSVLRPNALDSFGTFSTFSTFSTFGSGAGRVGRPELELGALQPGTAGLTQPALSIINRALTSGGG